MIPHDLATHITHIISWHRTWIDVLDFDTFGETVILDSEHRVKRIRSKMLRLQVRIRKSGFYRLQVISVPECSIASSIRKLSEQSGFRNRLQRRQMTCADINLLIETASDGLILLELED